MSLGVQPNTDFSKDSGISSANRKVWVLNSDFRPYTESFKNKEVTIPPNSQKIAKHAFDGGNLMEYVAARRLLGAPKNIFFKNEKGILIETPKALRTEELTPEENQAIFGLKEVSQKEALADEKKASRKLTAELKKVRNKVEMIEEP